MRAADGWSVVMIVNVERISSRSSLLTFCIIADAGVSVALLASVAPPPVLAEAGAAALLALAAPPPVLADAGAAALLATAAPPPVLADAGAAALLASVALPPVLAWWHLARKPPTAHASYNERQKMRLLQVFHWRFRLAMHACNLAITG